jgi:hypothetical protein
MAKCRLCGVVKINSGAVGSGYGGHVNEVLSGIDVEHEPLRKFINDGFKYVNRTENNAGIIIVEEGEELIVVDDKISLDLVVDVETPMVIGEGVAIPSIVYTTDNLAQGLPNVHLTQRFSKSDVDCQERHCV